MDVPITLAWYDYILFFVILISSILVGVFYGCFGNKQSTKNDYLSGGKTMKPLPVAMSLISCLSTGEVILGLSADVYRYGATFFLEMFSMIVLCFVTSYVFLPIFYKLQVSTAYEYLEKRFDKRTRQFASCIFVLNLTFYLCMAIYAPALTLAAVSGLSFKIVLPVVSGVCIFYTSIGGLRAVVWTDTFQFSITLIALLIVLVLGVSSVGGLTVIWNKSFDSGRLDIFNFDPNPTKRDSFWVMIIGLTTLSISFTSVDQLYVQKFLSLPKFRDASLALIYYAIGNSISHFILIMLGLVMYAKYSECDLVASKVIERNDQLLPYFVMDVTKGIPGISGIFIAGLFGSSLSVQAALLNCLSGTVYNDFVTKFLNANTSERRASNILKITVVIIGVICTLCVPLIQNMGGIFQLDMSAAGPLTGPCLGVFTLGIFFPRANSKGAFYGTFLGMVAALSIAIPAKYYEYIGFGDYPTKTLSTEGCPANTSLIIATTKNQIPGIFGISFYYYTVIGVICTIIFGLIISYMTENNTGLVNKELISPFCHRLLVQNEESDLCVNKDEENRVITNIK